MIPLLSSRHLSEFTPAEYKEYIRSLYAKREARRSAIKIKKPFTWRRNAKGTLIIKVNRDPKWLSHEEYEQIAREAAEPLNQLFLQLKKKKIKLSTLEVEQKIKLEIADLPF